MKQFAFLAVVAGLAIVFISPVSRAQDKPGKDKTDKNAPKAPVAAPAAAPLVEEKGRFKVLVDGQPTATEEFQISSGGGEWHARGTAEVPAASVGPSNGPSKGPSNGMTRVTGKLDLTADGAPLRYEWTASTTKKASATIEFHGNTAQMELRLEGTAPFNQDFSFDSQRVLILDNNLYHHYAILARLYDWKAKGPQSYSVFIPQDTTPGVILVEYVGPKVVEGVQLEMLRVRSADNEIELYCDNSSRLMRISVPSSKVEIIRE
jgi:hypothetical protein